MGKALIITFVIVIALLISGAAIAHYKGYCAATKGRIGWMVERLASQLDLNDAQQNSLTRLKEQIVLSINELRRDRSTYMEQAIDLLESPEFNRERAHTLLMQKQAQLASLSTDIIDAFAEFSNHLDQSQRDKLQSMIRHHREHRPCKFACGSSEQLTQK